MANEYFYPWYPAHYRRDAGHLDHLSDSCYRRLIDAYMEGGEPIRKDAVRLMSIMRVSAEQFALVWSQIEGFFTLDQRGYLHHKRCNLELDRQDALVRQKSAAGLRSAEKRKERSQQLQLLTNARSTPVQHSFNAGSTAVPPTNKTNKTEEHKNDASASPVPDTKTQLFTTCLTWLAALNGKEPNKYRPTVGMWIRDYGEVKTLQVFVEAQKDNPQGDRVAYMTRLLKSRPRKVPQI